VTNRAHVAVRLRPIEFLLAHFFRSSTASKDLPNPVPDGTGPLQSAFL